MHGIMPQSMPIKHGPVSPIGWEESTQVIKCVFAPPRLPRSVSKHSTKTPKQQRHGERDRRRAAPWFRRNKNAAAGCARACQRRLFWMLRSQRTRWDFDCSDRDVGSAGTMTTSLYQHGQKCSVPMFGLPRFLKCTLFEFCPLGCNANCFFELFFFLLEQAAEVCFNYINHQTTGVPRSPLTYCNILSPWMEKKKTLHVKQNHLYRPLEMVFRFWAPLPGWNQLGYNSNWSFSPKGFCFSVFFRHYYCILLVKWMLGTSPLCTRYIDLIWTNLCKFKQGVKMYWRRRKSVVSPNLWPQSR